MLTFILALLLFGYPVVLAAALLGAAISAGRCWHAHRQKQREPRLRAARWLLLCVSSLVAIACADLGALAWLRWIHRVPTWPARGVASVHADDELVIAVIGGSSARGVPYDGWLSVGEIVGRELQRVCVGRYVRVEMLADNGATLAAMHLKLAGLRCRPDALIIYSGHNEFLARFPQSNRVAYYQDDPMRERPKTWLDRAGRASPLLCLVRENLAKERVRMIPTGYLSTMETVVGRPVCTREETQSVLDEFHNRLEAIIGTCLQIGCLPVLIVPPGNDASDPTQSYAEASTVARSRQELYRRLLEIRALERDDAAGAIAAYRDLLVHQPAHAEVHFRLARLLESAGAYGEANHHYILARDHDGLPLRAVSPLEEAYRAVAARHRADVVLVDGPMVLRARAPHGILDHHLFHDNVHATLAGYIALAEAVLAGLKARGAFGWPSSTPVPRLDSHQCADLAGFQNKDWITVCERTATQYGQIAFLTINSAERVAWRDRYTEAARRIRAGTSPERAGIPTVGFAGESPEPPPN